MSNVSSELLSHGSASGAEDEGAVHWSKESEKLNPQSVSRLHQCWVCAAERHWILLCSRSSDMLGDSRASQVEQVFQALDVHFFCRGNFVCKNLYLNLLAWLFECLTEAGAEQTCVKYLPLRDSTQRDCRVAWALENHWAPSAANSLCCVRCDVLKTAVPAAFQWCLALLISLPVCPSLWGHKVLPLPACLAFS